MSPAANESPVDEYERRLAERRDSATRIVRRWADAALIRLLVAAVLFGLTVVVDSLSEVPPLDSLWLILIAASAASFAAVLVAAANAAVATIRFWASLPLSSRVNGIAPWMVAAGLTFAAVVLVAAG